MAIFALIVSIAIFWASHANALPMRNLRARRTTDPRETFVVGAPMLLLDSTEVEASSIDGSSSDGVSSGSLSLSGPSEPSGSRGPLGYVFIPYDLGVQDDSFSDLAVANIPRSKFDLEKRSVEKSGEETMDDLETAAGTNVLRPLFVYRQQVAYRQRVKDANRRRSRF